LNPASVKIRLWFASFAQEHVGPCSMTVEEHSQQKPFREKRTPITCRIFLLAARSCGLGIDLPGISAVVIHDSDWDPRLDLQAVPILFLQIPFLVASAPPEGICCRIAQAHMSAWTA